MAATAHKEEEEKKEHFDAPAVLAEKLDTLAAWIQEARHFTAFTGAGISTSAGIPDFRSGMNTVLDVGPGAWELRAAKAARPRAAAAKTKSSLKAIPTPTHMLLVALQEAGLLKYLVSQNTDGLHRRSGFPAAALAELHGNSRLEYCKACGKQCLRDFRVRRKGNRVHNHKTSRPCPACGAAAMYDTIINFGESLPAAELEAGFAHCGRSDLCLAMGSSLRVTPAAEMPEGTADAGGRLVIVNLQSTPLDGKAAMVIHAKTDEVAAGLAERLGLLIPHWHLRRTIALRVQPTLKTVAPRGEKPSVPPGGRERSAFKLTDVTVGVEALDATGDTFSCLTGAELRVEDLTVQHLCLGTAGAVGEAADAALPVTVHASAAGACSKLRCKKDALGAALAPVLDGKEPRAKYADAVRVSGTAVARLAFVQNYGEPVAEVRSAFDVLVPANKAMGRLMRAALAPAAVAAAAPTGGLAPSEAAPAGAAAAEAPAVTAPALAMWGVGTAVGLQLDPAAGGEWAPAPPLYTGPVHRSTTAAAAAAKRKYDGGQAITR